jgi:hypothetical protein
MNDNFPEIEILIEVWHNWNPAHTPLVLTLGAFILLAYLYRKLL